MSKKRYEIICSAYDRRGRLICSAVNSYKDSSALMRYYAMKVGKPYCKWNHAEISCLDKAMKLRKVVDKLVIIRYDCFGNLKDCMPCIICRYAIKDFNIKMVMYSTEMGMKRL